MPKYRIYIDYGFAGCTGEVDFELDGDPTPEDELHEAIDWAEGEISNVVSWYHERLDDDDV